MSKRFDDYQEVKCNVCEEYWTSACDGAKVGQERQCTAYRATRDIDIEDRLAELEERHQAMRVVIVVIALVNLILLFL